MVGWGGFGATQWEVSYRHMVGWGGVWDMGDTGRQLTLQTHVVRSSGAYLAQTCHRMGTGCRVRAMEEFLVVSLCYAL